MKVILLLVFFRVFVACGTGGNGSLWTNAGFFRLRVCNGKDTAGAALQVASLLSFFGIRSHENISAGLSVVYDVQNTLSISSQSAGRNQLADFSALGLRPKNITILDWDSASRYPYLPYAKAMAALPCTAYVEQQRLSLGRITLSYLLIYFNKYFTNALNT